jgi:hypothetical protein
MLDAHTLGMTNGEYVFIHYKTVAPFLSDEWYNSQDAERNEASRKYVTAL